MRTLVAAVAILLASVSLSSALGAQAPLSFDYDYAAEAALAAEMDVDNPDPEQLRAVFAARRHRVMQTLPEGAMLVFSVERAQERRLEFQVPHSDNHDFIYLTGLDGIDSLDSALLLIPAAPDAAGRLDEPDGDRAVLFTSGDPEAMSARTNVASPPVSRISSINLAPRVSSLAAATTRAPSSAQSCAVVLPIPAVAPVMTMTRSSTALPSCLPDRQTLPNNCTGGVWSE